MKRFLILKTTLLITVLGLSAGCKRIEDAPPVWQCQYNGSPRAFYCVNTHTKQRMKIPAEHPQMKAAQCLSAQDFKTMQRYVDYLIDESKRRCR